MQKVLILLATPEDEAITAAGQTLLRDFRLSYELRVGSALIAADYLREIITAFQKAGGEAILCVAPYQDPLAPLASSCSTLPVVSVLTGSPHNLPMPGPLPVASMGSGAEGFTQAALFIVQMLALKNAELALNVQRYRHSLAARSIAADQKHRVTFDV